MLTVKFMKYGPAFEQQPTHTEAICIREAAAVHVRYGADGRAVVQCNDAPGETYEVTVGDKESSFNVAYIMNKEGRTVETVR